MTGKSFSGMKNSSCLRERKFTSSLRRTDWSFAIVEIADGFEPSAKRELHRGPGDAFKEIDTLSRCLRGQGTLSELLNDGIRIEGEDGSMIAFDFDVGFIDQAEDRTSEEVCRKKVPASNLEKLGTVGLFDRYFDP